MGAVYDRAAAAAAQLRPLLPASHTVGVALGSGLGGFADLLTDPRSVPFADLPDFPVSTVPGHRGRFVFGSLSGRFLAVLQGRVHLYEGYSVEDVVLPVRVLGLLGVPTLLLTNAAGGIAPGLDPGTLMLLTDHIASFVPSPLRGPNEEAFGPRFPDMTQVYAPALREQALSAARELGIDLRPGVYLQTPGPAYETPAEVRLYRTLGADAVGMSTACEAVAARHMGLAVCGISCITNRAAGLGAGPLSHAEVQSAAQRSAQAFHRLLRALIARL